MNGIRLIDDSRLATREAACPGYTRLHLLVVCCALLSPCLKAAGSPLYDRDFVLKAPLDAKRLSSREEDGVVHEEVEFVGCRDRDGEPIRTFGRLYRPVGVEDLPVILWCEGGMSDARPNGIALILARKGYLTLSINLPKKEWGAHEAFNTTTPADANFMRFAVTYMRALTYLLSRPEADGERVGIGGASYGGVFSTLVSGLDPRIDTGMSFFSGGNHRLGTNLPQFCKLAGMDAVSVFDRTGDGAFRHRERAIPFLWGVAANDNWFHFPAVVQTWRDSQSPDSRLGIMPQWEHGFPPSFDQQLFDWFDVHLLRTRAPYNKPGKLHLSRDGDRLLAEWDWQGENRVVQAELVVSYGVVLPWHGWVHRLHHRIKATVEGNAATAVVPIAERDMDMLIYGNCTDENSVLMSTDPITARADDFGPMPARGEPPVLDGCPWGDFEAEAESVFRSFGVLDRLGVLDPETRHEGEKSLRVEPTAYPREKGTPLRMKLFNVYARSHGLRLWLKADRDAQLTLSACGVPPQNWNSSAVQALLGESASPYRDANQGDLPVFEKTVDCGPEWQAYILECPFNGRPVEGYNLEVRFPEDSEAVYWLDDITFTPRWQTPPAPQAPRD